MGEAPFNLRATAPKWGPCAGMGALGATYGEYFVTLTDLQVIKLFIFRGQKGNLP